MQKEHKDIEELERVSISGQVGRSHTEIHQSALTVYVTNKNHNIDWDDVRLPAKESYWKKRGVQEAIFIRK